MLTWLLGALSAPLAGRGRARAQGLGAFSAGPPPCRPDVKPTPSTPQGTEFKAGAPERASLTEAGVAGRGFVLSGTVSGVTCGPIKQARVDFWQADAQGAYDTSGFRLRGFQITDGVGGYRLETIVPGPSKGRAPCLHVKVQPPGKAAFTSQLFFPDQRLNRTDPQFRQELLIAVSDTAGGGSGRFDIVLDL